MTLIYIYITIFTIYFVSLAIMSLRHQTRIRDRYTSKDANLCVVVYASGNSNTLENLVNQLKNQTYPKNNYTVYTILDKCENVSEVFLQTEKGVNVVNINNLEPVGKSQAYSIIAEKLQDIKDLDAYVFLDAKNYIESNFLENVNFYLQKYQVFNPVTIYLPENEDMTLTQKVKATYSKYCSNFITASRTRLGLTNIINTDAFIIKKDLLNKIACFDFRDVFSETEYSYKLAKENINVAQIQDLRVFDSIEKFDYRIPSLSKRFNLFTSNILKPQNMLSREFLFSLIAPNWLVCLISYILVLKHAYIFPFWVSYSTILITSIVLLLAFCASLLNVGLKSKEYAYLLLYPIFSIGRLLYNFPPYRSVRNMIKQTTRKHVIESETVNVIVSDGKKDFPCQLVLISDDGLAKVTFNNKGKKYTTKNNHLRMIDAVRELTVKLADYGLTLKVCQCCKYFSPIVDGSTNMVKGSCNCQFQGRTPGDIIPTLIWNTCPKFEEQNVVNLF